MVVKMKRLELLLYHKEREHFLESLRSLGVVHFVESEAVTDSIEVQKGSAIVRRCERVVQNLKKIKKEKQLSLSGKESASALDLLDHYDALLEKHEKLSQELQIIKKDCELMEPWGVFDFPIIKKLSDVNVNLRFFTTSLKKFASFNTSEDTIIVKINEVDGLAYFIVIDYGTVAPVDADEVRLPAQSLAILDNKMSEHNARLKECESSIENLTAYINVVDAFRIENENQLKYKKAHLSMADHAEGKLLHLAGWFPAERESAISGFLKNYSAWYSMRDPLPDDDVPVKLKNALFPKLFEPITGIYSLPHYLELDITPFMAPFFTLFFGLCLGDVGYGTLLLAGCLFAGRKVPAKMKPLLTLVTILSISTIISGVLLNSFFGQPFFGGPGVKGAFLSSGVQTFSPLSPITTEKGTVYPMMSLALLLGFIQLLFGMGIKAYIAIRNNGFTYGLQPISTMLLVVGTVIWGAHVDLLSLGIPTFSVGPVLVGKMLLAVPMVIAKLLIFTGFGLFFLFNNMGMKIFMRPLIGIYEFYNFASGILGQVLSYIRLFALGLAGGLLGAAFNQIAFMFITQADGTVNYASIGIVGTILVLILGHGMNLSLALIGSFVHPLRLTFVEFYGAIGFRGGSKPFQPFTKIK